MLPTPSAVICANCGARIETTGSGEIGCLGCLLQAGLEREGEVGPAEVPETLGTYRIERHDDGTPWELGRGAMGVTYRAQDISLERAVALKLIGPEFCQRGAEARERFVREARAAASLHHPHVAAIYQFGIDEDSGHCFSAMELIEGETLDQLVRRTGPLDVLTVIEIARQIVSALIAAGKGGIVHRDLKPANVMVAGTDEAGKVTIKVIDFGLAKALSENEETRALTGGGFLGTPAFASPEQLRRVKVDVRSDIYSLGATLWFLLTGHTPFGDAAPARPPEEQLKSAHVPKRLVTLLLAMLAPEPAARPSAREIEARLAPPPLRRAGWKSIVTGASVCLLALGGAAYFFSQSHPPPADPAILPRSIAVLPFQNLNGDPGSANFVDGVQDELLTDLARVAQLKVVNRDSVATYKHGLPRDLRAISRELGVAFLVEGSVRQAAGTVHMNAQLTDARTGVLRWSQNYDRPVTEVFAIQSEIAQAVAAQLGAKIAPPEKARIETPPTPDLTAFSLYNRAKVLLIATSFNPRGKANFMEAAQLLGEAVARDPNFLLAWCELASAHDSLYFLGLDRTSLRLSLGEDAIKTALQLQPDSGEAHLARARHLYQCYLAYEPALNELEIARRTLPNHVGVFTLAGYLYRRQGKWEESNNAFTNALALDPRNTSVLQQVAISYNLQRRYQDAGNILDQALRLTPENIDLRAARAEVEFNWHADTRPLHQLASAILARNPAAAPDLAGLSLILGFCERDPVATKNAIVALGDGIFGPDAMQFRHFFWEGLAARMDGDTDAAERAFTAARAEQARKVEAAPDFAPALCILGLIDAGLGHKADAIREGRRAVEMLPISREPINGAHMVEFLAMIYAWSGEPSPACVELEKATKLPGTLSYGQLRLSPMWDDLRGHTRFKKIVASLAPDDNR